MTTTLKALTMRPGTVCPAYLFGAEVKASGQARAGFVRYTWPSVPGADRLDGRGMFGNWGASMSSEDMQKVKAVSSLPGRAPRIRDL